MVGYLAVVCLGIAAKFNGDTTGRVTQYRASIAISLSEQGVPVDFNRLELEVMQTLEWNVSTVTAVEVAECIVALLRRRAAEASSLESHVTKIISLCVTGTGEARFPVDYAFCRYNPSMVAIGSILASAELQNQIELRDRLIRKLYRTFDDDYIVSSLDING